MYTFGFIGTGNMGRALAEAVSRKHDASEICLSNRTKEKAAILAEKLGCKVASNTEVAAQSQYIFLGVKPQIMPALLSEIQPVLKDRIKRKDRFVLITMAAGLSLDTVSKLSGESVPVIRIMPNTPVSVGAGMILYTANKLVSEEELTFFESALENAGICDRIDESKIDAASILSGCAPAYMFLFVKAMVESGLKLGLDEEKARLYVEQTMFGSAKLALMTQEDPENLKIAVCSPGGTTIEGIKSFEKDNFEETVNRAINASYQRTLELAGKR